MDTSSTSCTCGAEENMVHDPGCKAQVTRRPVWPPQIEHKHVTSHGRIVVAPVPKEAPTHIRIALFDDEGCKHVGDLSPASALGMAEALRDLVYEIGAAESED